MLRNKIGPVSTLEMGLLFLFIFFFCLKNPLLSAGKTRFSKTKKTKIIKNLDQFLTLEKANIGPVFNSTAYIYICIYICISQSGQPVWGPRFSKRNEPVRGPPERRFRAHRVWHFEKSISKEIVLTKEPKNHKLVTSWSRSSLL